MNPLLYKDLRNLKPMFAWYIIMLLIFTIVFIPMGNDLALYIIMVLFGVILPLTSITYDKAANWDKFALTTSLGRDKIVRSKYLLQMLLIVGASVIACIVVLAIMLFINPETLMIGGNVDPLTLFLSLCVVGLFAGSISLPLVYKYGSEKAMVFTIVSAIVPMITVYILFSIAEESGTLAGFNLLPILMGGALVVMLALSYVSYRISLGIYRKTDL